MEPVPYSDSVAAMMNGHSLEYHLHIWCIAAQVMDDCPYHDPIQESTVFARGGVRITHTLHCMALFANSLHINIHKDALNMIVASGVSIVALTAILCFAPHVEAVVSHSIVGHFQGRQAARGSGLCSPLQGLVIQVVRLWRCLLRSCLLITLAEIGPVCCWHMLHTAPRRR